MVLSLTHTYTLFKGTHITIAQLLSRFFSVFLVIHGSSRDVMQSIYPPTAHVLWRVRTGMARRLSAASLNATQQPKSC